MTTPTTPPLDPHSVYRCWSEDNELLYIGCSRNPLKRWMNLASKHWWWPQVMSISIEHHDTRKEGFRAEALAIAAEKPRYNIVHNRQLSRSERDALRQMPDRTPLMSAADRESHMLGVGRYWNRLDPDKVRAMRARYESGESLRTLAKEAGVARSTMRRACTTETWRFVKEAA